ncbi:MAG: response regulator [Candidatus Omnitrophica bacterium]|nr:response regulator [Candidatus Omnitrophota bacterium]
MEKKVLVVDDEPYIVEAVERILTQKGYQVIGARNGEDGLKKAKEILPDLIILDILMPVMDGTTMAQSLQEDFLTKKIPVVFLTCLIREEEIRGFYPSGGKYQLLAKPFTPEQLIEVVDKILVGK